MTTSVIAVRLDDLIISKIDVHARQHGISRATVVKSLIEFTFDPDNAVVNKGVNSEVADEKPAFIGSTPVDFTCLMGIIFPNPESACLANELMVMKCVDDLPSWFRSMLIEHALKHNTTYDRLLMKLQTKPALLRLMVIEEVEQSAKDNNLKLLDKPTPAGELEVTDKVVQPMSTPEATKLLDEMSDVSWWSTSSASIAS